MSQFFEGYIDTRHANKNMVWIRAYFKVRDLPDPQAITINIWNMQEDLVDFEKTEGGDLIIWEALEDLEKYIEDEVLKNE